MASLKVTAKNEDEKRGLLMVANYCGLADKVACELGAETSTTSGEAAVAGFNTVCTVIVQAAGKGPQLLGDTAELQAQVDEWMTFKHTQLTPLKDDQLRKLNDWLATRMYVVGGRLTLADLVLFDAVYPAVAAFPAAQTLHFCNLLRWADLLQHTADVAGLYQLLAFQKPVFVPPVAPPPAPKAAAAAPAAAKAYSGSSSKSTATAAAKGAAADGKQSATAAAAAAGKPVKGATALAGDASSAPASEKKDRKEKKEKAAAAPADGGASAVAVDLVDIRVGTIVKVDKHPNADALYVEEIDLGEEQPRQIVSGLVKFVPVEKMQGRRVVVVCNLKPAKMRDVMSYGMVLCASNETHDAVDPIIPPEGVPNGERITFEGHAREPEAVLPPKKKIFEQVAEDLKSDGNGVAVYKGIPFMTSKGPVTTTIPNALIR